MQVFGRTLICRDMDKASYFAKNANLDCITLEGRLQQLTILISQSFCINLERLDSPSPCVVHQITNITHNNIYFSCLVYLLKMDIVISSLILLL